MRVTSLALIALETSSDRCDSSRKSSESAILVVTVEGVSVAVILIVEDDVFIREIAEMMIQDWGHETLSAGDVDEALLILRSAQHIDALFTDIYLKNLVVGGCDLAHEAIALRPGLRVLYTTGNTVNEKMQALFIAGTQCLRKPYTQYQLQDCFTALLPA